MSVDSTTLLNLLGSSIKPLGVGLSASPAEGQPGAFQAALELARSGELSTSLPVAVEPAVDVELSNEELDAIAFIADQAAARGAESVAIIHGDDVLTLDVDSRRIIGSEQFGSGLSAGADLIARLPSEFEKVLALPGTMLSHTADKFNAGRASVNINSSLLDVLGKSSG